MFEVAPAPLLLLTPDLVVVHANRALLDATGPVFRSATGRQLFQALPRARTGGPSVEGWTALRRSLERARDSRRPDSLMAQRYVVATADGRSEERFWSHWTVPVLGDRDDVVLLIHRVDDITDSVRSGDGVHPDRADGVRLVERVHRAEADLGARTRELEQASARLRVLGDRERRTAQRLAGLATTVSALSVAETRSDLLRQVFRSGRQALHADVLAVGLLEPGGSHLAVVDDRGSDGSGRRVPVSSPAAIAAAAAGRRVLEEDAGEVPSAAPLPGLRAWAALPLRIGRRPLGSLTVGWRSPQVFEDDDVQVLEAFAAQCSQAVQRVARREAERRQARATRSLAESLQRSLLTSPPQLDHLEIAVRYRPAAREVQIGGDWYDAFPSPDGATTLVVGDVTGHDWTAAAVAGQLRSMLRGIASALDHRDPDRVLSALDRALDQTGIETLATAIIARVEEAPVPPPGGGQILRWSNAGHPPPLLLGPDGTAILLERPADLLLGVTPDTPRRHHTVLLDRGATLVLYTDGLVERRDATLDDGLRRLLALGPSLAGRPVRELCDEILDRMRPDLTDDIALVALRVTGAARKADG